jgi:dual specificity MAP kinase phosphatase
MYEILPELFLASFNDVRLAGFDTNDYFIVNCTRDLPMLGPRGARIPVDDAPSQNNQMFQYFPLIVRKIRERLVAGDAVIVHCRAGQQRSAAVIAAYLIRYNGMSKNEAIAYIRRCKSDAFYISATFDNALTVWENAQVLRSLQ